MQDPLAPFSEATRIWFQRAFSSPTRVQAEGWEAIASGKDALLIAPTGSGKTLAAFLVAIDRLGIPRETPAEPSYRAIYLSPLKALVYDVERNLGTPLRGIEVLAHHLKLPFQTPTVDVRTGDTPQEQRRRQAAHPGDILVTTPESLYLMLTSDVRRRLTGVEFIIIDEIHALAPTKRGVHLALSLERLEAITHKRPQRIGLSATVRPLEEVARYLTGNKACAIIDTAAPPRLDLEVTVPIEDMTQPPAFLERSGPLLAVTKPQSEESPVPTLWNAIEPRVLELILENRSTIIFVSSRGHAERLAQRLNELHLMALEAMEQSAPAPDFSLVRAHHGSVSHDQRRDIEEQLKRGTLRAIVATSSLELGIDMGAVELVLQIGSPDSAARGLQRVGRAGHHVGGISHGKIFPKHRNDLVEASVISKMMLEGHIESVRVPKNPLDVLAQHIVAMVAMEDWRIGELKQLVRKSYPYNELSDEVFSGLIDMLSGQFASTPTADLRARLNYDRTTETLSARKGSKLIAVSNAGTIPDRGLYGVFLADEGDSKHSKRVGELDEEMVHEAHVGQTFILGASTWRIREITRDRVLVTPAPGESGTLPFWRGDSPGRPIETGRRLGAFLRQLEELIQEDGAGPESLADAALSTNYPLDRFGRQNLLAHLQAQRELTGGLPTDKRIIVETFRDELGDTRLCILSPFGSRVHAPWALAIEETLGQRTGQEVETIYTDDGIALRIAASSEPIPWEWLSVDPADLEERLIERLATSALFASHFRENAARALLLPRRSPTGRAPLWQQRLRSANLLGAVRQHANFPILLETYRSILQDVFDVPALLEILSALERREIVLQEVQTPRASPFARSIAFAYVAQHIYEGDLPVAERRAQALSLDRHLLRELLGQDELRKLFKPELLEALEQELQCLVPPYRIGDADRLHDVVRKLGALSVAELQARADLSPAELHTALALLVSQRRLISMRLQGETKYLAIEDAVLYLEALGAAPPQGLPESLLAPVGGTLEDNALARLVRRYARSHGPFARTSLLAWLELPAEAVQPTLDALVKANALDEGTYLPDGDASEPEYIDPEVLRRLRRRTLAALREEVAPVDAPALARFLARWQGLKPLESHVREAQAARLREVMAQLEGFPLYLSELENTLLPLRIPGYQPRLLDNACALGELVWVGHSPLGAKDGRILFYLRESASLLLEVPPTPEDLSPLETELLEVFQRLGAAFSSEIFGQLSHLRVSSEEIHAALWSLVWRGLLTNDTLAPLRHYLEHGASAPSPRANPRMTGLAGRWSLTSRLTNPRVNPTERTLSHVERALSRWGLVFREIIEQEPSLASFSTAASALRAMEDLGKVRRGHFIDGVSSSQFALPGVVDRLRGSDPNTLTSGIEGPKALVLASTDPANPYGSLVGWPSLGPTELPRGGFKRAAGSLVVLNEGQLLLYVARGSGKAFAFPDLLESESLARTVFSALALTLSKLRERRPLKELNHLRIRGSRWEAILRESGFQSDYSGFVAKAHIPVASTTSRIVTPTGQTGYAPPALFAPPSLDVSAETSSEIPVKTGFRFKRRS